MSAAASTSGIQPQVAATAKDPATNIVHKYKVTALDIWALGVTMSAQSLSWNQGYTAGCVSYTVAAIVIGVAYVLLTQCLGEIMSMMPFSGGAYGLARCTIGFAAGFFVAAAEIIEYMAYSSTAMLSLCTLIVYINPGATIYQPIFWFVGYLLCLSVHIYGSTLFWRVNLFVGILSLTITVLWILGSIAFLDFSASNIPPDTLYMGGVPGVMKALPSATWLYVGIEALSTAGDDMANPREVVPKGQRYAMYTLFFTGVTSIMWCSGLPPAIQDMPNVVSTTNSGTTLRSE